MISSAGSGPVPLKSSLHLRTFGRIKTVLPSCLQRGWRYLYLAHRYEQTIEKRAEKQTSRCFELGADAKVPSSHKEKKCRRKYIIMWANIVAEQGASSQVCRVPFVTAVICLEMLLLI